MARTAVHEDQPAAVDLTTSSSTARGVAFSMDEGGGFVLTDATAEVNLGRELIDSERRYRTLLTTHRTCFSRLARTSA